MKILFLGRKFDIYSKKLLKFLKKKNSVDIIWSDKKQKKLKINVKKKYDYIICFRSFYILSKKHIKSAKIAAINFHPGAPKYRGIGCINLALLKNEKFYGSTAHMINEKIDNGKIIDVRYFKIKKSDNLPKLLSKTHKNMFIQSKEIIEKIIQRPENLKKLIKNNKDKKWSKSIMTKKKLDGLYEIKNEISVKKYKHLLRALEYKKYKPYIISQKKNFLKLSKGIKIIKLNKSINL